MDDKNLISILDSLKAIRVLFKTSFVDLVTNKEKEDIYKLLEKAEHDTISALNQVYE